MHRISDMQFVRDTVKKLIYAMEQNEVSSGKGVRGAGTARDSIKGRVNGGDFMGGTQLLPNLGEGEGANKNFANSFIEFRNSTADGGKQTTSEILYLKRLLFLKASLDNENNLNTLAVPLEEDKAFAQTPNTRRQSNVRTAPYNTRTSGGKLHSAHTMGLGGEVTTTAD